MGYIALGCWPRVGKMENQIWGLVNSMEDDYVMDGDDDMQEDDWEEDDDDMGDDDDDDDDDWEE